MMMKFLMIDHMKKFRFNAVLFLRCNLLSPTIIGPVLVGPALAHSSGGTAPRLTQFRSLFKKKKKKRKEKEKKKKKALYEIRVSSLVETAHVDSLKSNRFAT